jgi:hypothetical protein
MVYRLGLGGGVVTALLTRLDPGILRELAAVIEYRSPEATARRGLTPEGIERLADILLAGGTPTVGFWRRYRKGDA